MGLLNPVSYDKNTTFPVCQPSRCDASLKFGGGDGRRPALWPNSCGGAALGGLNRLQKPLAPSGPDAPSGGHVNTWGHPQADAFLGLRRLPFAAQVQKCCKVAGCCQQVLQSMLVTISICMVTFPYPVPLLGCASPLQLVANHGLTAQYRLICTIQVAY